MINLGILGLQFAGFRRVITPLCKVWDQPGRSCPIRLLCCSSFAKPKRNLLLLASRRVLEWPSSFHTSILAYNYLVLLGCTSATCPCEPCSQVICTCCSYTYAVLYWIMVWLREVWYQIRVYIYALCFCYSLSILQKYNKCCAYSSMSCMGEE